MATGQGRDGRPPIEEIAQALGISKTTVSRALSGKGRVSEETRAKVFAYVGRPGVDSSTPVRRQDPGATHNLSLVIPKHFMQLDLPFLRKCMGGVCTMAAQRGYDQLLCYVSDTDTVQLERQLDKIVGTRDNIPLDELFAAAGIDADRGRAAVERAIDHGYFGADAYIDNRTGTLVVRGAAPQPPRPAEPAPTPAPEDQYAALQRQLRQANDAIPDPVMTAKISRLEDVSARIFALAKKDPDKKAQLQKFMDYYLPTALKLLNTYAQLSAQDVQGTNITEAKQSIERSMDLLITAFENQLDKLFASDALDVSTDIAALEGMLNLDGLTGGDFAPRS